ncbi:DUF1800 family protein [Roseomonas sp. PWR1]|uniref:DUF1800 family protein n=1 Tax=Roseomonas nitratireducens TaxID=2820810 RepID=A0ABS4AXU8_9PROT|nr:DUF1800 family protein [Neoroseomonas nitratireducens]MBP0466200.1 DUF1800 family protein [Neoroseomonas nitratireducens]
MGEDAARRLLNRAAYGPRAEEAAAVARMSRREWVEAQLATPANDAALDAHLARMTLPIRYAAGPGEQFVEEERPLASLAMTQAQRWALGDNRRPIPWQERDRPRLDLIAATIARKVLARDQLRERLVEFWHDHFSVAAQASIQVSVCLPDHDARIRRHALGNFSELLEAMATSPAMLVYLNNRSSRAGAPNENFARELMELHTLGAAAYHPQARAWRDVPGAAEGRPAGYHDGDVWEAARAFTGWTLAAGQRVDAAQLLPPSGAFAYVERWHDGYQKRVLAQELPPFAPAMAHGRAVLAACAAHPATARHVATKLARFLVGEAPPPAAIARAEAAFLRHREAPDQIARSVAALLDGPEATDAAQGRMRRPLDAVAAAARGLAIPLTPKQQFIDEMGRAGQALFAWPAPDGQPVDAAPYLGAGALRARWALLLGLAQDWWRTGASPLAAALVGQPALRAARSLAAPLLGPASEAAIGAIGRAWAADRRPEIPRNPQEVSLLAGLLLLAPGFQRT